MRPWLQLLRSVLVSVNMIIILTTAIYFLRLVHLLLRTRVLALITMSLTSSGPGSMRVEATNTTPRHATLTSTTPTPANTTSG